MAVSDARISTGLPAHPKTVKLVRRLGEAGGWRLVCLFLWTAANRADGDLSDMTKEDVEIAAGWAGDPDKFVDELLAVGFLEGEERNYRIHDWEDHNPWAAGADNRALKSRWIALKRHHGEAEADRKVPGYAAIRNATGTKNDAASNAGSMHDASKSDAQGNAPSPSPLPIPSPLPSPEKPITPDGVIAAGEPAPTGDAGEQGDLIGGEPAAKPARAGRPPCPHTEIIALYHELLPMGTTIRDWTPARAKSLQARWNEKAERQSLDWWREFFAYMARSKFLTSKVEPQQGRPVFRVSLPWTIKAENFAKITEGDYHR